MRILALDLATRTGFVFWNGSKITDSGTAKFDVKKFDGGGVRFVKFETWLQAKIAVHEPTIIFYEGVRRHLGVDAAHVYGGLLAVLQKVGEQTGVPYTALTVQEIKKLATGKGNAKKDAMIAAATAKWPHIEIEDDNHADALWILEAARAQLKPASPEEELI